MKTAERKGLLSDLLAMRAQLAALDQQIAAARHGLDGILRRLADEDGGGGDDVAEPPRPRWLGDNAAHTAPEKER